MKSCNLDTKKIHLTVPKSFRRNSQIPKILELHFANLSKEDVKSARGYKVTTALKTLQDIIEVKTISHDFIEQAIKKGLATRSQIKNMVQKIQIDKSLKHEIEKLCKGGAK